MKNPSVFAFFCAALACAGCSEHSTFGNAGAIYHRLDNQAQRLPALKPASEGMYRFDICTYDTLFFNTNVQWFCDCTDPKSQGSVDSFAMAVVDEIRVVFFKRPKDQREINLNDPGKESKIGVYYWEYKHRNGLVRAKPLLVVKINSPKSKNKENDFSELFFEWKDTNLVLVAMTYFDDDSSLNDLTPRSKSNKKTDLFGSDPKEGLKTIRPKEVFAISEMVYRFVPQTVVLKLHDKPVEKIGYATDNNRGFTRTTTLKNGDQVVEMSANPKSIATW